MNGTKDLKNIYLFRMGKEVSDICKRKTREKIYNINPKVTGTNEICQGLHTLS